MQPIHARATRDRNLVEKSQRFTRVCDMRRKIIFRVASRAQRASSARNRCAIFYTRGPSQRHMHAPTKTVFGAREKRFCGRISGPRQRAGLAIFARARRLFWPPHSRVGHASTTL
ncbi:hypothetical protein [Massilia sp. CF038]|uniref:hypothetical protein n=1 Tax=Massilia sp. CF038 TaxID=1881045 RepID=UPI00116141A5|nr:hypothetical protein [Massilia sp. CF038]